MIFIDANIFMYAAGKDSPWKASCQQYLGRLIHPKTMAQHFINSEVLQEILHRYRSIGAAEKGFLLFDSIVTLGIHVVPVTRDTLVIARKTLEENSGLSTRDAIHVATLLELKRDSLVSYDKDFDKLGWVRRIEP